MAHFDENYFGKTAGMKVIFWDGMLKTGAFLFLVSTTFTFLLDVYNYLDESNDLVPLTAHFVRTEQTFQHIAFYLPIFLFGGTICGIITYAKQRKPENPNEKAFTNSTNN